MKKVYYELTLTQKSPLRIGGSDSERTDSDLLLDGRGMPFIPGSSIAGVLRSMIPEKDGIRIFGDINDGDIVNSRIVVGDGVQAEEKPVLLSKRDGVHLGDWGTVLNKYDYEVVETDYPYTSIIEWEGDEEQYKNDIEQVVDPLFGSIISSGIRFGARTSRGFGRMDVGVKKKMFDFPTDLSAWLDFNPYDRTKGKDQFAVCNDLVGDNQVDTSWIDIRAEITIDGNFSVSVPTSRVELAENGSSPDKIPLKNHKNLPVISGTAWAGTFRHHMNDLCQLLGIDRAQVNELFGIDNEEEHIFSKSRILFGETQIEGGKEVVITRNAIDRFTGGPKNTGLFTAELCYGGKGTLDISYSSSISDFQRQLIAMTLYDLQLGLVTVGGECGVGRGRIYIKNCCVNSKECMELLNKVLQDSCEISVDKLLEG